MTLLDPGPASSVVVNRWRRFGQDRAYVRVDGHDVGFRDLRTGVAECSVVAHLDTLMDATDNFVHLELLDSRPSSRPHVYRGRHLTPETPAPCMQVWLAPSA